MIDVVMPQMGESIVEGTLTKWLKKPGDRVERDEPLFEISTDKVDTEIPSVATGILAEVLVEEGETVGINTVVAKIEEGETPAAAAPAQESTAAGAVPEVAETPQPAPPSVEPEPEKRPEAVAGQVEEVPQPIAGPLSPLVRRLAREHNVDLSLVTGTGAGGRITKRDVEAYLAAPARPVPPALTPATAVARPGGGAQGATRVEAMSVMRSKIAEHMMLSKSTSAHVTTVHKIDMTQVAKIRERQKAAFKERYGISLTYLSFITKATADALRAFPLVNASIQGNNIVYHDEINIGIAVALENGLIVPVIGRADEINVVGLQRSIADLASRARSRQLKPTEVLGGTFSITNFGSYGSLFGTPVINQPQVAILGVGAIEKAPVVINDAIAIRSIAHIGLTFDHRLIDGALADQFLQKLKSTLENWCGEVL